MKKILLITILIILNSILSEFCSAQVKDSLIQLTPQIGDTISLSERNYYDLFPNIQGFEYATIFIRNDSVAVSKIVYQDVNGNSEELVIKNNVVYIGNLRAYIRQIDNDNLDFQKRADELKQIEKFGGISQLTILVTVTTKNGYDYKGLLWSVKGDSIFIIPDTVITKSNLDIMNNYLTFTSEDIQSVFIEGESNVGIGLGLGVLIGAAIGVGLGFASGGDDDGFFQTTAEDEAKLGGITFGLIGGVVGLVAGLLSSTSDRTIEINSASDVEQLKEYLVQ